MDRDQRRSLAFLTESTINRSHGIREGHASQQTQTPPEFREKDVFEEERVMQGNTKNNKTEDGRKNNTTVIRSYRSLNEAIE